MCLINNKKAECPGIPLNYFSFRSVLSASRFRSEPQVSARFGVGNGIRRYDSLGDMVAYMVGAYKPVDACLMQVVAHIVAHA